MPSAAQNLLLLRAVNGGKTLFRICSSSSSVRHLSARHPPPITTNVLPKAVTPWWLGPNTFPPLRRSTDPPLYSFGSVASYIWHSPNDPNIESLTRYAVEGYNQSENAQFELVKILKAEYVPVSGRLYIITIEVRDASASGARAALNKFHIEVWEEPWTNTRQLSAWNGRRMDYDLSSVIENAEKVWSKKESILNNEKNILS